MLIVQDQYKWRDCKEKVVVLQLLAHSLHFGKITKKKKGPCITAGLLSSLFWFCVINTIINDRPPQPPVHFLLGEHFSSEVCVRDGWDARSLMKEQQKHSSRGLASSRLIHGLMLRPDSSNPIVYFSKWDSFSLDGWNYSTSWRVSPPLSNRGHHRAL